jgi:hypothetical protein
MYNPDSLNFIKRIPNNLEELIWCCEAGLLSSVICCNAERPSSELVTALGQFKL